MSFKFVIFATLTSLSLVSAVEDKGCVGTASFFKLSKAQIPLSYDWTGHLEVCHQHEKNSCCGPNLTEKVQFQVRRSVVSKGKDHWFRGLRPACQVALESSLCTVCDASAGRAALTISKGGEVIYVRDDRRPALCLDMCEYWHKLCGGSFFAWDALQGRLESCSGANELCWQANQFENSVKFCEAFGFSVISDVGTDHELSAYCYRNTQKASRGPQRPNSPLSRQFSVKRTLLNTSDRVLKVIEMVSRRVGTLGIWFIIIGILWVISRTNRLTIGSLDNQERTNCF